MTHRMSTRRSGESGYAMLLVFLIAAMIAIALYREMPRVSFEAQRAKEQLLVERGEQYKRAIQLFVRKVNRYPATIEELESLNNMRFLRKRYVDPMTGKDKWRLIHTNGGVLTDSIIQKNKPGQDPQQANTNTFIGEGPIMGASNDPNQQQINPALRRRASDDRPVVTQDAPAQAEPDPDNSADTDNSNDNNDNNDQTPAPATPGAAAGVPGTPNQPGRLPGVFPGAYPGQPGYNPSTANQPFGTQGGPNQITNPGMNGSQTGGQDSSGSVYVAPSLGQSPPVNTSSVNGVPGQPGYPGQPGGFPGRPGMLPGQAGGFPNQGGFNQQQSAFGGQQQSGFGGQQQSGFGGQQQSGFGAQMTSFGPGGASPTGQSGPGNMFGMTGPSAMQPQGLPGMGGTQVGGGIAGVASESTGPAIKIYNERKKYNEWEFVYDQSKDRGLAGVQRGGGAPGTPAGQMGSMPGQQPNGSGGFGASGIGGNNASGGPNGAGSVSGGIFGQGSGFGQQSPQPQPQQPQQQPQN